MDRRRYLGLLSSGLAGSAAGCSEVLTSDQTTATEAVSSTPTDGGPLSVGETASSNHKHITVTEVAVQKSVGAEGFSPFLAEATGQFLLVYVDLDKDGPNNAKFNRPKTEVMTQDSRDIHYARAPPIGHPTPLPPEFEPTLKLTVGDHGISPSVMKLERTGGEYLAFDVPAEEFQSGKIVWVETDPMVAWEVPKSALSQLPSSPQFVRHSLSASFVEQYRVGVTIDVENTSSGSGVYRAIIIAPRADPGHHSDLLEREIPGNTRVSISETPSITSYSNGEEARIIFDTGKGERDMTVYKDE